MNKKVFGFALTVFFLAMMIAPVMAIGQKKATNSENPHLVFQPWAVQLQLSNGILHEWVYEIPIHIQIKKPADFNMGNFNVPNNPSENLKNKWNFLSEDVLYQYFLFVGFDEETSAYVAYVIYAGGVFYKAEFAGN